MHLFCVEVKEVCNIDGMFSQDKLLPKTFATLQIHPPGESEAILERHEATMKKCAEHAAGVGDKTIKFMKLEGRDLELIGDQVRHYWFMV